MGAGPGRGLKGRCGCEVFRSRLAAGRRTSGWAASSWVGRCPRRLGACNVASGQIRKNPGEAGSRVDVDVDQQRPHPGHESSSLRLLNVGGREHALYHAEPVGLVQKQLLKNDGLIIKDG